MEYEQGLTHALRMTLSDLAKYSTTRIVARSLCDSWASCSWCQCQWYLQAESVVSFGIPMYILYIQSQHWKNAILGNEAWMGAMQSAMLAAYNTLCWMTPVPLYSSTTSLSRQVNMYACSESIFLRIWVWTNTFPVSARPAFIIFVNSDASGGRLTLFRRRHSFTPSWRRVSIIAMQSSLRLRRQQQTGYNEC